LTCHCFSGPIRNNPRRGGRGGGRGRGGRRGGASGGGGPKKPKTAEELDKELDAFMVDSPKDAATAPAAGSATTETVAAAPTQDVDMDL
jgi:THO complex subunit 4